MKTIKPYQRTTGDLEHLVQALYLQGLTLNEISEHLMGRSSTDLSRESVRKLAKEAEEFRSRALSECVVAFMDGTYVPLKRNYSADRPDQGLRGLQPQREAAKFAIGLGEEEKDSMGFERGFERGFEGGARGSEITQTSCNSSARIWQ